MNHMLPDPQSMSNEQLAAQCIMPRLVPRDYVEQEALREEFAQLIQRGIGGFCVFQGEADATSLLLHDLQQKSTIPLLFSADYEHGLPMRLEGGTDMPHAMAMMQSGSPEATKKAAEFIAKEARTIGVHWNFAPVCDINSNPENPIINIRSFGETSHQAEKHIQAYIEGTQAQSVLACAKHFPGHGDTSTDSHSALPLIDCSLQELQEREFIPFKSAIDAGVRSIMIGHLAIPSIDDSGIPASLSAVVMNNILRKEWQYEGIIVTDALDMHAISKTYTSAEATIACLKAGATIALVPDNAIEALDGLIQYIEEHPEFRITLIEQVERIFAEKSWCGLETTPALQHPLSSQVMEEHAMHALDIAKKALRIHDPKNILPIPDAKPFAAFAVLGDESQSTLDKAVALFRVMAQSLEQECDFGFINKEISSDEAKELSENIKDVDTVILGFLMKPQSYKGHIGIHPAMLEAIDILCKDKTVIALLLGSPYLHDCIKADAYVCAFSDALPSLAAAALTLSGRATGSEWTMNDAGSFHPETH
ncbi:MAG: glycoside hydrolase family 3 protein [Candidatus Kapaibacteriota bacterium]